MLPNMNPKKPDTYGFDKDETSQKHINKYDGTTDATKSMRVRPTEQNKPKLKKY